MIGYENDPTYLLDHVPSPRRGKPSVPRETTDSGINIFEGVSDNLDTWFKFVKVHTNQGYTQEEIVEMWEKRPSFVRN